MYNYSREDAFRSMDNFHENFSWSYDMDNYSSIQNMTNIQMNPTGNETITENSIKSFFTPISDYWVAGSVMGAWFYVIIMLFTVGVVYGKTKRLEPTAITMLILSMIAAVPATTGDWVLPVEVLGIVYTCTALSVAGVLYSTFTGGRK